MNITTNRSRVREPQRALMSDTLSLVLPLNWWLYGVGSSASGRSSAQLQWHSRDFCWTGFCDPCKGLCRVSGEGCMLLSVEHVGIYTAKSEFCTNRTFCLVLDGVWVSEVPECCSLARSTTIVWSGGSQHLENPLAKRQAFGNGSVKPPVLGLQLLPHRISVF